MSIRAEMLALLAEESPPSVAKIDDFVTYLEGVRKRVTAYKAEFARLAGHDPLAEYASAFMTELGRILREGIVDLEKAVSYVDED